MKNRHQLTSNDSGTRRPLRSPSDREAPRRRDWVALGDGDRVDYPMPSNAASSAVMRGNRKRDTKPELAIRRLLHASGFRYRVNAPVIIGTVRVRPDIVFRTLRLAIFVDGCFWHGCPIHGTNPRVNAHYWGPKIERNRQRDARYSSLLTDAGWSVIRAWEHEPATAVAARVAAALRERRLKSR